MITDLDYKILLLKKAHVYSACTQMTWLIGILEPLIYADDMVIYMFKSSPKRFKSNLNNLNLNNCSTLI